MGEVVKATVSYDKSGRSNGTARVLFVKREDARKAIEEFNGVELDGQAIEIAFDQGGAPSTGRGAPPRAKVAGNFIVSSSGGRKVIKR